MKTKTIKLGIMATIITLYIFSSCKKYENGPAFSLWSKKNRLCGEWVLKSATLNGNDITTTIGNLFIYKDGITINTDHTYKTKGNFIETGKWILASRKENIELTSDANGQTIVYQILKLENKALWWKFTTPGGDNYIWKFNQE